ncbi:hypothetical protein SGFS_082110 [Streptomyces graminofaciens]|uniref:Uncharacterized protein n=1 Tax=Streptomyces graminofaciens TaxID=68212 RepID=A0ABM7FJP2_9ACTN|nr:hypothetical protein SGFS_082110 [Streptomyces graminofaciens]
MTPATAGREAIAVVQAARVPMNRLIAATRVIPRCNCWGPAPGAPDTRTGVGGGAVEFVAARRRVQVPVSVR